MEVTQGFVVTAASDQQSTVSRLLAGRTLQRTQLDPVGRWLNFDTTCVIQQRHSRHFGLDRCT
ncbi:hypothetical protein D3C78_1709290 [compost metagenome]